jgi:hypothetical protein
MIEREDGPRGPQVSLKRDSTLADPQQVIDDLKRRLADAEQRAAERTVERDEARHGIPRPLRSCRSSTHRPVTWHLFSMRCSIERCDCAALPSGSCIRSTASASRCWRFVA